MGLFLVIQLNHAQQPPAVVKTVAVSNTEMAPMRIVSAYTKAKFITNIKAESSGRVIEIAPIGHSFSTNEALGLIADDEYALRLNELRNAMNSQQAQLRFLQSESLRLKSLEEKKLTSGTDLDKNAADLKAAKADLAQAKSRYQQLENDIKKLNPKAPYNGFISQHHAQPGQWLNEGENLLEIMSSDQTEIIAQLPIKLKSVILIGQTWQYKDQSGNIHEAEVERFIPAATSNSRLIQVHLQDLSNQLLPGEPIQLMVPETLPKAVMAVPRDALVLRRQGAYIFVIKEGLAHKVDVQTGLADADMIAVKGNLSAGDQVVIRGNERLRDQQSVQILSEGE